MIAEDWCGDASSTVPVLARLADAVPGLELRIILRDQYPEVMDQYLTNGSRSIPIVIALDEEFREVGHWGPRPRELQAWVMANRPTMPKAELYPKVRQWYARDQGETTLREVLEAGGVAGERRSRDRARSEHPPRAHREVEAVGSAGKVEREDGRPENAEGDSSAAADFHVLRWSA